MSKKWKIFGIQTNLEWYDIKTKFKQILRKVVYSWLFQEIICSIFVIYMKLVYLTSKKVFINLDSALEIIKNKHPLIVCFWHNRLMMIPFITLPKVTKLPSHCKFMALASRHGDGKIIGRITQKFGLISILGSTRKNRNPSRGINFSSMRGIIDGLKQGHSLGITPDGPRGPNKKINGEIINIARISGAGILPISYSSSRFKQLKTWDKFKISLPFSTLCFYVDEKPFYVDKNTEQSEIKNIEFEIEKRLNFVEEESQKIANNQGSSSIASKQLLKK